MNKKQKKAAKVPQFERPVDRYFYEMDQRFWGGNKGLYALGITLAFFGIMGIIWMIPFPKLGILERMNMQNFLNWGSFFIAIVIYLYLKLAPTLSYAVLFCIAIMSFFIVQLEYLQQHGGPAVWLVSALIALIGLISLYLQAKKVPGQDPFKTLWQLLSIGPIWLWSKVFSLLKMKY